MFIVALLRAAIKLTYKAIIRFGRRQIARWSYPHRPIALRILAVRVGWIVGAMAAVFVVGVSYIFSGMPSPDDVWNATGNGSLTVQDRYGRVFSRERSQYAEPIDLDAVPPHVSFAFIAIEDRRFYEHLGVDLFGTLRALIRNVRTGSVSQGGSTITQQLAKNLFLSNERTAIRKVREALLAIWLESKFTKKQILSLYLSRVYFGSGAYGLNAASEFYFDKEARELTLAESALLAGLMKAPSRLTQRENSTSAKARALSVLQAMLAEGFITAEQRDQAAREPLPIHYENPNTNSGYFKDWIQPTLRRIIGRDTGDFIIETTLDIEAQRASEDVLTQLLDDRGERLSVGQGALLCLDSDGGVRVMVGGKSYPYSQFNRTTQARRQPGSTFKFFVLAAAIPQLMLTSETLVNDRPIVWQDWSPRNFDDYAGWTTLSDAMRTSSNSVAVQLTQAVGTDSVVGTSKMLGVRSRLRSQKGISLGNQEVTLLELGGAYATMTNQGRRVTAHGISRVMRTGGNTIWNWRTLDETLLLDQRTRRVMNSLLQKVVEGGTGTRARIDGREVAGKTGTGDEYRDAWFVGYSGNLTMAVWFGNDDASRMNGVTGGSLPAEAWREAMTVALRKEPATALVAETRKDRDDGSPRFPR